MTDFLLMGVGFVVAMLVICLCRVVVLITRLENRLDWLERTPPFKTRAFHTDALNQAVMRRDRPPRPRL